MDEVDRGDPIVVREIQCKTPETLDELTHRMHEQGWSYLPFILQYLESQVFEMRLKSLLAPQLMNYIWKPYVNFMTKEHTIIAEGTALA